MWKKKDIVYFFIRMRDDDVGVEDIFMRDEESRLILFLDVHDVGGNRRVFHVEDEDKFVFLKPLLLEIMASLIAMAMSQWRMQIMKVKILCFVQKKSMKV